MGFDVLKIGATTGKDLRREVATQVQRQLAKDGTVDLLEAYDYNATWGCLVFRILGGEDGEAGLGSEGTYKFKVLYLDKTGTPAKPGEKFKVDMGPKTSYFNQEGRQVPMDSKYYNTAKRRYNAKKRPEDNPDIIKEYRLDKDNCIQVPFDVAVHLLVQCSVHSTRVLEAEDVTHELDQHGRKTGKILSTSYNHLVEFATPSEDKQALPVDDVEVFSKKQRN